VRSKYSNVVVVVLAILAFAPLLAVHSLLDSYVRFRETTQLQHAVDTIAAEVGGSADDAIGALQRILADSPSLCTPTFLANAHREMVTSLDIKQVLVEDISGGQYCNALASLLAYRPLSASLSIPGHSETVAVVRFNGLDMPMLRVTQVFGADRRLSVFVPMLGEPARTVLDGLWPASLLRLSLTDGTPVLTVGNGTDYDRRAPDSSFIAAQSFAGEMPVRVEAAIPFAAARASYGALGAGFTVVACALCAALLVLMLNYVRRAKLSAFDLERAIIHGELKPYYQPVIDMSTGRLAGCEMLCRWEKKNGEVVPPGAFIEEAEQTGLAIPMTLSLMQQIRTDLGGLCRDMPELKVSINLFEGHFRDGAIVEDVQAIFGGSPIAFRQLVFEITERRPLANSVEAKKVIGGLHALGSRLAMDDAGTGHSNLAYLQTLGVDVIKIDRVFVDMVKPETTQVPVLDGLISLARDLGTEIVAEGVETQEQALYLRARGVAMAQGYLFAPALKATSFRALARALNGGPADGASLQSAA